MMGFKQRLAILGVLAFLAHTSCSDISESDQAKIEAAKRKNIEAKQEYTKAAQWYSEMAEKGDPVAQYSLGLMYYGGQGMKQDYAEASKWYRKAAEQGHAKAQYSLGLMYYNGLGVTTDYAEAFKWLTLSSDQGLEESTRSLQNVVQRMTPEQLTEGRQRAAAAKTSKPSP